MFSHLGYLGLGSHVEVQIRESGSPKNSLLLRWSHHQSQLASQPGVSGKAAVTKTIFAFNRLHCDTLKRLTRSLPLPLFLCCPQGRVSLCGGQQGGCTLGREEFLEAFLLLYQACTSPELMKIQHVAKFVHKCESFLLNPYLERSMCGKNCVWETEIVWRRYSIFH